MASPSFLFERFFILLFESRVVGSVFVNILLGSAIAFPVFALSKQWSNRLVASAVTLIVLFNPLMFRNSLQGISEIPCFFFSASALHFLARSLTDGPGRKGMFAACAGVFVTIASGMRYEAWLLICLLSVIIIMAGRWRILGYFLSTALVFPVSWMITNHVAQGNPFKGLEHVIHWQASAPPVAILGTELLLHRIFFPISFLLACTPFALVFSVLSITMVLRGRKVFAQQVAWLMPFPVILFTMVHMASNAELLLQHRFTCTLLLAFIPYMVIGFDSFKSHTTIWVSTLTILTMSLSMSFVQATCQRLRAGVFAPEWNEAVQIIQETSLDQLWAIPKLRNDKPHRVLEKMDALPPGPRLLVLEFFGWEETYNVAFRSNMIATSTVFLSDHGDAEGGIEFLNAYLHHIPGSDGVLVLHAEGPYYKALATLPDGRPFFRLPHRDLVLGAFAIVEDLHLFTFSTKTPMTETRTGLVQDQGSSIR